MDLSHGYQPHGHPQVQPEAVAAHHGQHSGTTVLKFWGINTSISFLSVSLQRETQSLSSGSPFILEGASPFLLTLVPAGLPTSFPSPAPTAIPGETFQPGPQATVVSVKNTAPCKPTVPKLTLPLAGNLVGTPDFEPGLVVCDDPSPLGVLT